MADRTKSSADPNNRQAVDITDPENIFIAQLLLSAEEHLVELGVDRVRVARAMIGLGTGSLARQLGIEETRRELKDNDTALDLFERHLKIN